MKKAFITGITGQDGSSLSDTGQIFDIVYNIKPDEIYHLVAQSHVRVSFDIPEYTSDITALGTIRLLEAIRRTGIQTKFYQASSSEMVGISPESLFYDVN
jgi:GDPmannose 4,6-dehydratase